MNLVPLDIVTPEGRVYQGPIYMLTARTGGGEIGILPGHSPLVATVLPCVVKVQTADETFYFAVSGGFLEVLPDRVSLLADTAEQGAEVDRERARAALQRAEERLAQNPADADAERLEKAVERARIRLQAAELQQQGQSSAVRR